MAVIIGIWYWVSADKAEAPTAENTSETSDLQAEVEGLNTADINAELQTVDKEAEQL